MAIKALSGGDKLEATLRELSKKARNAATLKVGFQNGATYPDGQLVSMVAAFNEFGAPSRKQPPRPFFRNMIAKNVSGWGAKLGVYLDSSNFDAKVALDKLGENMIGELQDSIVATNEPSLSPITVMLRYMKRKDQNLIVTGKTVGEAARRVAAGESNHGESTKPLVETGHMLNSITSVIE